MKVARERLFSFVPEGRELVILPRADILAVACFLYLHGEKEES